MTYQVELRPPARRALDKLPAKAFDAVVAFIAGPLSDNPHRVGKPLRNELDGLRSARVGPYRLLYEVNDVICVVAVVRIAHRADAYR
jgi:mRNA interferase RelE/StbE